MQNFIKKEQDEFHVPDAENQAIDLLKDAASKVKSSDIVKASA